MIEMIANYLNFFKPSALLIYTKLYWSIKIK